MLFLNLVLIIFSVIIAIFSLVIFFECTAAFFHNKLDQNPQEIEDTVNSIAVLIPAKDEAELIESTIRSILPQLRDSDRLVVIADRCTDDTAKIARSIPGVTVLERNEVDENAWGKGFAVDYGIQHLAVDPPEVVVLVDADCLVERKTILEAANLAKGNNQPVQATYWMEVPSNSRMTSRLRISTFAIIVKNIVRPLGLSKLGYPCLLNGSGMAFPWLAITNPKIKVANDNIVEDLKLGIDLAIAKYSPLYLYLPQKDGSPGGVKGRIKTDNSAKKRWIEGYLKTIFKESPKLIVQALIQGRFDLFALALELSVPPLTRLFFLWIVGISVALTLFFWIHIGGLPLVILSLAGFLMASGILLAWAKYGRQQLPLNSLF